MRTRPSIGGVECSRMFAVTAIVSQSLTCARQLAELGDFAISGRRVRGRAWRAALALALPLFYVAAVSILGERGENMRFRFFLANMQ